MLKLLILSISISCFAYSGQADMQIRNVSEQYEKISEKITDFNLNFINISIEYNNIIYQFSKIENPTPLQINHLILDLKRIQIKLNSFKF